MQQNELDVRIDIRVDINLTFEVFCENEKNLEENILRKICRTSPIWHGFGIANPTFNRNGTLVLACSAINRWSVEFFP